MRRVALATWLAGCAPAPARVLATYEANLRAGRIDQAYALTSARYRSTHDLPTFAAAVARIPLVGDPPTRGGATRYVLRAGSDVFSGPTPQTLAFAEDPFGAYRHDTPERTLRAFVRAVRGQRREVLVALTSLPLRAKIQLSASVIVPFPPALSASAQRVDARLALHEGLAPPIIEHDANGRAARLLLGGGEFVGLVESPGGWVVSEIP